jgi:hypothetical protein
LEIMRVQMIASSAAATGLKVGTVSVASLLVVLARGDEPRDVLTSYALSTAWSAASLALVFVVFTSIWLRRRRAAPLPGDARIVTFGEVLRPEKYDVVLVTVFVVGIPFLFSAEDAALLTAYGIGTMIAAVAQVLLVRAWERRSGVVLFWRPAWGWGFPPLYSEAPRS